MLKGKALHCTIQDNVNKRQVKTKGEQVFSPGLQRSPHTVNLFSKFVSIRANFTLCYVIRNYSVFSPFLALFTGW